MSRLTDYQLDAMIERLKITVLTRQACGDERGQRKAQAKLIAYCDERRGRRAGTLAQQPQRHWINGEAQ